MDDLNRNNRENQKPDVMEYQANSMVEVANRLLQTHSNNNATTENDTRQFNSSNRTEEKERLIRKVLKRPSNMRLFTKPQLVPPYWEKVINTDPKETFEPREMPAGLTSAQKSDFNFAVELGQNIAKWHQENKPVVCEYLLFLKDESLKILKPQFSAIIKKCSRRTKCYVIMTNRILNKQVGKFKWVKYLIVQIQGPDYTNVQSCNKMLEMWFPEYKQRIEYKKIRYKFGMCVGENTVDNLDLYFPYQRSSKCAVLFGDLKCQTPYGATIKRTNLSTPWKAHNKLMQLGNLLPKQPQTEMARDYVYAFHPLGAMDRHAFRVAFGIKEPPSTFTPRKDVGIPPPNLCGPDHPSHPICFDKGEAQEELDEDVGKKEEEEDDHLDSSKFILGDPAMKSKFKFLKMKLIMKQRKEMIYGDQKLAVPFPQALLPTTALTDAKAFTAGKDEGKSIKKKKKKVVGSVKNIRFINEDNVFIEYCFEKEHLKRNPISPYPRSLVPGRELAETAKQTKISIGPIKYDFVRDRREELATRFFFIASGKSPSAPDKSISISKTSGKPKTQTAKKEVHTEADAGRPGIAFNDFKAKVSEDAKASGADPDDLFGKGLISSKNVDKIVPGWRGLVKRKDNIYEEIRTRLNVHRTLKNKYSNTHTFYNPQFDPYEDIPITDAKTRVRGKIQRQAVGGLQLTETNPQKLAALLDNLDEFYKKDKKIAKANSQNT